MISGGKNKGDYCERIKGILVRNLEFNSGKPDLYPGCTWE